MGTDICLAMLDINKFKFFNDTYGHKKGDEILREYSTDKGRPELSLAYGFVRLTAADLSAVHEAISRADKLLYENKKNAR